MAVEDEEQLTEEEVQEQEDVDQEVDGEGVPEQDYATYEDVLKAQKINMRDVLEHITGPVISVIVHVVLISLLGTIIVFRPPEERKDIEVDVQEVEIKELEKIPEPPKPPEEVEVELEVEIDRPDVTTEKVTVDVDKVAVEDVAVDIDMPDLLAVKPSDSALKLPGVYSMRSTAAGRKSALKRYGGSAKTEKAVLKALAWLKSKQNEDGSWGVNKGTMPAFTSLVVLAFLAHGETPQSAEFGATIIKGVRRLLEWAEATQKRKGKYISGPTYTHAICAYAIAESYGITRMPRLKTAMNNTIQILIDGINCRGCYFYGYDKRLLLPWPHRNPYTGRYPKDYKPTEPRCDLSFSGWNYQALKAAFSAGCDLPGLEETIDKSIKGLKHFYKLGRIGKGDFGMNCLGTLCFGLLGQGKCREAKAGLKLIKNNKVQVINCSWRWQDKIYKKYKKAFEWAMYTWYYQTQVIFQMTKGRGSFWTRWNAAFSKAYVREQHEDGYWSTPAEKYGSGVVDPVKDNAEFTHVIQFKKPLDLYIYSTALACLCLEVYYRYLPTYKLERRGAGKKSGFFDADEEDDDLGLSIE